MEEEREGSSYITTSSLIDAQFHDLIHTEYESEGSSSGPRSQATQQKPPKDQNDADLTSDDENQDWEWVEETEYVVLDFGGVNLDARDIEKLTEKGYNLVVRLSFCPNTVSQQRTYSACGRKWSNDEYSPTFLFLLGFGYTHTIL